ncbi:dynamin family protein [Brachyspira alvinipulli]|uniref:dynamin family protein n=1 Tax=Brachyspira alvinipulli TaxID=84379 RepID=UPI00047F6811|nr:dynamin family protein [Brachyspira alvinipulli]
MNIVLEDKLINILDFYSKENKLGTKLLEIKNKISNNREDIVPVLGMQGMGKSTLINSILAENILPNEADETTCVPVEVKYGEDKKAEVYFFDSDKIEIVHTMDELKEYVDNNYNHGNEKNVEKIVLFRPLEILKNGLVIVDLPGVGSLTKNNEKTTKKYIENLSCALFVIPTSPTIRRHEEVFIRSIWEIFTNVIFVQNEFGENKREIEEAIDYNTKILKSIAEKIKTEFKEDIMVVNAYKAAYGRIYKDEEKIKSSNIEVLLKKLENFAHDNKIKSEEIFNIRLNNYIKSAVDSIKDLIEAVNGSNEQLKEKLEENENKFKKQNIEIEEKVESIINYLNNAKKSIRNFAENISVEYFGKFRSQMHNIIDQGVVDGPNLSQSFEDYQRDYYSEISNAVLDEFTSIRFEIEKQILELSDIINNEDYKLSFNNMSFSKPQSFKWEKGLDVGIKIGGSVGGVFAGMAIGGAIGGPLGAAVGLLAGTAISLISAFIGSKSRKAILAQRASEVKDELEDYFKEFKDGIKNNITGNFNNMHTAIIKSLEDYVDDRKKEFKEMKRENEELIKKDFKQEYDLNKLQEDLNYLQSLNAKEK